MEIRLKMKVKIEEIENKNNRKKQSNKKLFLLNDYNIDKSLTILRRLF